MDRIALMKQQRMETIMAERKRDSKTPGTLKEVLSHNVRQQQRRSSYTASPPEAKRPVRERVKSAAKKSRS